MLPALITILTINYFGLSAKGQLRGVSWDEKNVPDQPFPPLPTGISRSHTAIAPWSKYQQKLRAEQQLAGRRYLGLPSQKEPSPKPVPQPEFASTDMFDSSIPVIITLNPYEVEQARQASALSGGKTEIPFGTPRRDNQKALKHMLFSSAKNLEPSLKPKPLYSTATNQQQFPAIQQNKVIYAQRLNTKTILEKPPAQNSYSHNPNYLLSNAVSDQNPSQGRSYAVLQKPPSQVMGANTLQLPITGASNVMRSLPQYSRLGLPPALPFSPQSSNIASSIFAQSQIRPAPLPISGNDITNAGHNIASFLTSDHVVEDISKIARNLLSLPGPNQQELFSALTSAITGNKGIPLSSNTITDSALPQPSNILNAKDLFSSVAKKELTGSESSNSTEFNLEKALKSLPEEQRALLEAAVQSGELESASVLTAINGSKNAVDKISTNSENRLIEWIQQNRPRPKAKEPSAIPSDKLPYYGKYCGSFIEQVNIKKHYDVTGAIWAVDDHRFIISKFHFIPGSLLTENVTFWAGPANVTGDAAADMTPSSNGFYLRPEPINIMTFLTKEVKMYVWKIAKAVGLQKCRTRLQKIKAKIRGTKAENSEISGSKSSGNHTKEEAKTRNKRDWFTEAYEEPTVSFIQEVFPHDHLNITSDKVLHLAAQGGTLNAANSSSSPVIESNGFKNHFGDTTPLVINITFANATTGPTSTTQLASAAMGMSTLNSAAGVTATTISTTRIKETTTTVSLSPTSATTSPIAVEKSSDGDEITPLGWYAGFQPLLLTLPDNKWLKSVYWLAIRDHKRERTVASVLIPNGPAFKIPAIVQLRPLTPNGVCAVTSGPIKVLDTKTIEISDLSLKCDGVEAWFMIGKDILPNDNGQIVPIYNKEEESFDCDSLPQYSNQTVTLRLPGAHDIKDVFWFSVFSIKQGVSLSHIYLPYNDMQLPPDLNGIATPECIWHSA